MMTINLMKQYAVEIEEEMNMWDEIEKSVIQLPLMTLAEYESHLSVDAQQLHYDVELHEFDEVDYILDAKNRRVWVMTYANIIHPHLKSFRKILLCFSEKNGITLDFLEDPAGEWLTYSGAEIVDIDTYGIAAEKFSIDVSELFKFSEHQQSFIDVILMDFLKTNREKLKYEDFETFLKQF